MRADSKNIVWSYNAKWVETGKNVASIKKASSSLVPPQDSAKEDVDPEADPQLWGLPPSH